MIYFLLPNVHYKMYEYIDCIISEKTPTSIISNSLSHYLYEIKYKIDKCEKDWEVYKKYTNPYEYITTAPLTKNKCVSKYKSLSRSYYKMIEIIDNFNLIGQSEPIKTFHLAEGPGGFIEAILNTRNNEKDSYIGITLLEDMNDINIPSWSKSEEFLNKNKNVFIENGIDKTGNILSIENFKYCVNKYGSSMDIITGDGGFDFSVDFNNQEINITKLLFAQMCYAICLQKQGGSFVLKIFDCFMQHTIDIIYILSSFYKRVYICKPQTSRYANSEKYLVCKGFLFSSNKKFYSHFFKILDIIIKSEEHIFRLLNCNISNLFISKLEEYNAIFGQQQIETILNTLLFIDMKNKNDRIDNIVKNNIQKSINWCIKYNVPYNKISNTNIFTGENED